MRIVLLAAMLAAVLPSAAAAAEEHPLAALAARAADELVRLAAGRPVQVDVPDDRTGLAGAALDLQSLIEARLGERAAVARSGPRVRLSSALARSATRLRLVGRLTAEPGGTLVDVLAVSVEADPDLLELSVLPRPPRGTVAVLSSNRSAPLGSRVLDLAFADDDRLIVLLEDGVALYQRVGEDLVRRDHRPLDATLVVRAPAGVVVHATGEAAFWVSTNLAEGAVLFTIDGGRLQEIERAAALPWPGAGQGARFHPGTNTIDVALPGLGSGPHLRAAAGPTPWAIAPDGRFGVARAWSTTRIGSAGARLWTSAWIASSPEPPGPRDALLVLDASGGTPAVVATFPVPGSVTAIGARARGDRAYVAAATVESGAHRLIVMEIARDTP